LIWSWSTKYIGVIEQKIEMEDLKFELTKDVVISELKEEIRNSKVKYMIQVWFSHCKIYKLHQELDKYQNDLAMKNIELEHYNHYTTKPSEKRKCVITWGFARWNFSEVNLPRQSESISKTDTKTEVIDESTEIYNPLLEFNTVVSTSIILKYMKLLKFVDQWNYIRFLSEISNFENEFINLEAFESICTKIN